MSKEPEVKKKLIDYLDKKRYSFPFSKSKQRQKEFSITTKYYGLRIRLDIMAFKKKRNHDEILLIECKGSEVRSIAQGYGQLLYYQFMYKKAYKDLLDKRLTKLGLDPKKHKNYQFCFAYHEDAYKKFKRVMNKFAKIYSTQGIRSYIVGKKVIVKRES